MSGFLINPYIYGGAAPAEEVFNEATGYNFGAEAGATTGWTVTSGSLGVGTTIPTPNSGTYRFTLTGATEAYSDVALSSSLNSAIDSGDVYLSVTSYVRHATASGTQGVTTYGLFYNGVGGTEVSSAPRTSPVLGVRENIWHFRGNGWQQLPSGTRCIRVVMDSTNTAFIDDIVVTVKQLERLTITGSMTNPTFETGTTTGWTGMTGVYQNSDPIPDNTKSAFEGTYWGYNSAFGSSSGDAARQDTTIPDTGTWYDSIDAGEVDVVASFLMNRQGSNTMRFGMDLDTYDTGLTNLVTNSLHVAESRAAGAANAFVRNYAVPYTLTANKRILRTQFLRGANGGSTNYFYYDDVTLDLYRPL